MSLNIVILIFLSFSFFIAECFFSYKRTSLSDRFSYLLKDIPYFCFNIFVPAFLIKAIIYYYSIFLYFLFPSFSPLFNQISLSPIILFSIGFIISDLVGYLTHRYLYHKKFWFLHKMHHSSKVVRWHSSFRFNPIELAITTSIIYIIYSLIGIPKYLFYDLIIFNYFINYLAHSELPLGNKYIELFIVTPNYHRIHHSVDIVDQKSNYAGIFTVWDRLFNTVNTSTKKNIQLGVE